MQIESNISLAKDCSKLLENYEKTLVNKFQQDGIEIEINKDFKRLKSTLVAANDYDYEYDTFFDHDVFDLDTGMALFASRNGKVIATYSYRVFDMEEFFEDMKNWVSSTNGEWIFNGTLPGKSVYSSCQWVDSEFRHQSLGVRLDNLKKVNSLRVLNWDTQFSHCKEMLHHYHLDYLNYKHSVLAFRSHSVPGSGSKEDKNYYLNWISKDEYLQFIKERQG